MTDTGFDRTFIRAGFGLIFLALVTGLAIPAFANPRMALAAHVSAILNGLLLIALGAAWSRVALSAGQARVARTAAFLGAYANWATACLAAAFGTSRLTPLSGAGHAALPWQESLVQVLQVSLAMAMLLALGLVVYGLRATAAK